MKTVRVVVAVLAGLLALGGCTLPARERTAPDAPITIEHAFGVTTVTGTPRNVVALGDQWTDAALALGVTPVGRLGGEPSPWTPPALASVPSLDATGDLTARIAALRPDLILLDRLPADRATYDRLAALAPTVPRPDGGSWRDRVRLAGTALRRTAQADRFIAEYDTALDAAVRAHPGLAGRSYAVTWLAGDTQLFALAEPAGDAAEPFARLGLRVADEVTDRPSHQGHVLFAPEEIGGIDADLLLAGHSPGFDEKYRALPGYGGIPAVSRDAVVALDTVEIAAVEQPTALSAPYLLGRLTPVLGAAAG